MPHSPDAQQLFWGLGSDHYDEATTSHHLLHSFDCDGRDATNFGRHSCCESSSSVEIALPSAANCRESSSNSRKRLASCSPIRSSHAARPRPSTGQAVGGEAVDPESAKGSSHFKASLSSVVCQCSQAPVGTTCPSTEVGPDDGSSRVAARHLYRLASPCLSVAPVGLPQGSFILILIIMAMGVMPLRSRAMLLVLVLIILPVSLLVSAGCSRSLFSSHSFRFIAAWPPLVSLDLTLLVIVSLLFLLVGVIMGSAQLSGGQLLNTASTVTLSCALFPPMVRSAPSCTVFHSEVGAWHA